MTYDNPDFSLPPCDCPSAARARAAGSSRTGTATLPNGTGPLSIVRSWCGAEVGAGRPACQRAKGRQQGSKKGRPGNHIPRSSTQNTLSLLIGLRIIRKPWPGRKPCGASAGSAPAPAAAAGGGVRRLLQPGRYAHLRGAGGFSLSGPGPGGGSRAGGALSLSLPDGATEFPGSAYIVERWRKSRAPGRGPGGRTGYRSSPGSGHCHASGAAAGCPHDWGGQKPAGGGWGRAGTGGRGIPPLSWQGRMVGWILRTRTGIEPLFVSPGHRVNFTDSRESRWAACGDTACLNPCARPTC